MRDAAREILITAIGQRQPITEGALATALGAMAPVPEVLRTQLMQLERGGEIRRDNNRRFSLKEPEPMAKTEVKTDSKATKLCYRCKQEKPPDEILQNGYCRSCNRAYGRERYAASKVKGGGYADELLPRMGTRRRRGLPARAAAWRRSSSWPSPIEPVKCIASSSVRPRPSS